jgi:hypothetical protein
MDYDMDTKYITPEGYVLDRNKCVLKGLYIDRWVGEKLEEYGEIARGLPIMALTMPYDPERHAHLVSWRCT